jgi:hypothetical protein
MPVGAFYIDRSGLDAFAKKLEEVSGSVKDLSKVYRDIGREAALYTIANEPVYGGPAKGRQVTVHLQERTTGGGGKRGAWAKIGGVPYLYVQMIGGTSFWHSQGAGVIRKANRAHISYSKLAGYAPGAGHVIYKKPRNPRGYFLWNVAYQLRSRIGAKLANGIRDISVRHGILMDVEDTNLGIPQSVWGGE